MRRALWIASATALTVLLSACTISGGTPIGDQVDAEVSALTGSGAALGDQTPVATSVTLSPGEDRLYRLNLPSSAEPALYVYLNRSLDLYLYRGSGSLYATASSGASFAAGTAGLSLMADDASLTPQIVDAQLCPGSCIIAENPGSGGVYVRVLNDSGTTVTYTLWAILTGFDDENEAAADEDDPLPIADVESGAIETIGDVDYFEVTDSGELFFDYVDDAGTGLDLVAEIVSFETSEVVDRIYPGGSAFVAFAESVHVRAENPRAAVSGNSQYFLELLPD